MKEPVGRHRWGIPQETATDPRGPSIADDREGPYDSHSKLPYGAYALEKEVGAEVLLSANKIPKRVTPAGETIGKPMSTGSGVGAPGRLPENSAGWYVKWDWEHQSTAEGPAV